MIPRLEDGTERIRIVKRAFQNATAQHTDAHRVQGLVCAVGEHAVGAAAGVVEA